MGESTIEYLSKDDTFVFWNLEDYPIPIGADLGSIYPNIKSALRQMGFDRLVLIWVYGDKLSHDRSALSKAEIFYIPEASGGENSADIKMAFELIVTASATHGDPTNLVVIAKQSPERELTRVLQCLKSRNYTVLVVEPTDDTAEDGLFHSVESVVDCTHVFGGGKPIRRRPQSSASDTDEEDASSS